MKTHKPYSYFFLVLFLLVTLLNVFIYSEASAQTKQILGWVEKVRIFPADIVIHAKMDSGADYSSINAYQISKFDRNGADWVKFTLKNRYGHKAVIEKKIVRMAKIKRHGSKAIERYVIRLGLCLGGTYMEEEVNLADRSQFDFQMLIGRSFLSGNVLIDPSLQYSFEPDCKNLDAEEENSLAGSPSVSLTNDAKKNLTSPEISSSMQIPHRFAKDKTPAIDLTKSKPKSNTKKVTTKNTVNKKLAKK